MAMHRVQLLIHPSALSHLRLLSGETGLSVSDLVRRAVDNYLSDLEQVRSGILPSSTEDDDGRT